MWDLSSEDWGVGELLGCASAYPPHWLACLHGIPTFPERRVALGFLLVSASAGSVPGQQR